MKDNRTKKIKIGYVPQKINVERHMPTTVYDLFASCISDIPVFLKKDKKLYKEIKEQLKGTALTKEDKEEFARFGESLGYLDVEMQKNAMKLYLKELEQKIEYLQKEIPQKRKLYQSLGVMGGIFLLILLWQ